MAYWSMSGRGRLWDNETGSAYRDYKGKRSYVKYGLDKGSPDLIGFEIIEGVPIFCGVEVKTISYSKLSKEQTEWLNMLVVFGCRAYVARESNNDNGYILEEWKIR